jgi:signal transduction histidine kinase
MRAILSPIKAGGWLLLVLIGSTAGLLAREILPAGGLTTAAQIRELTPAQAARALPVSLTGVVMDSADPNRQAIILADQTAGIYVLGTQNLMTNYNRGDRVEIKGVSDPGGFAPIVLAATVRKLGTAPIPEPQTVTYQQLISGAMDAQWVEIKGVVRRWYQPGAGSNVRRITVAVEGGPVSVRFYKESGEQIQVDAEVRVRAVCLYEFNQKRQVLNPVLQIPRGVSIVVEKPAPADPYHAPVRSITSLLMFTPENLYSFAHRVHVCGVVTYSESGSSVWIQDGASGLHIQTHQQENLVPGDKIDVLGFPTFGSYSSVLEDAVFLKTGATRPPAPLTLTNFDTAFDHGDDLVAVQGTLAQIQPVLDGLAFTLDKDGKSFKAILKTSPGGPAQPDWQTGSNVRITGICSLIHDGDRPYAGISQAQSFQILLRSPADLTVLKPPPWWTSRHIIFVLGIFVVASLLVAGGAIQLSRRRLHEQKRRRDMAEKEFVAILAERNRLAREIHDTLAQGLGAISVQLELAKSRLAPDANGAGEHLNTAHQLVRSSLADARNSIWNMRSQVLETGDLPSALAGILQQLSGGTGMEGRMCVKGRPCRLPPVTENNFLRIGQEAITNAMKHARAKLIEVELEFADKAARLRVKDNGRGFDTAHPPAGESGFGLMGMRERAAELHGQLTIRSVAGRGTEITFTVPIAG